MATTKPRGKVPAKAAPKRAPRKQPDSSAAEHSFDLGKVDGSSPSQATKVPPIDSASARFVAEYLVDFNGTRAYMAAHPGAKENSARTEAWRMLTKPDIQAAIADSARRTASKMELTQERVYRETARIAFFDPRKLFKADGSPLQITELDDDTAGAIAGLEVLEAYEGAGEARKLVGHVKKYKVADKNAALERAAKLLALFKDDNAQRVNPLVAILERMGRSAFPVVKDPDTDG